VTDLVSHLVGLELLAFEKISERSSPSTGIRSRISGGRTLFRAEVMPRREAKSLEALLSEFRRFRTAVIELVERGGNSSADGEEAYDFVVELCVTRFGQRVEQIEAWRNSGDIDPEIGSLEIHLNEAILKIDVADVVPGEFDVQALFLQSVGDYYSEDVAFWIGDKLIAGKSEGYEQLAGIIERAFIAIENGLGAVDSLRVVRNSCDLQGQFTTVWELAFRGSHWTRTRFGWRTTRLWKDHMVIAERIEKFPGLGFEFGALR